MTEEKAPAQTAVASPNPVVVAAGRAKDSVTAIFKEVTVLSPADVHARSSF